MNPLCFLLGVAVLDCNPQAQEYLEAFERVPAEHRNLVKLLDVDADRTRGRSNRDGTIRITAGDHQHQLFHEVGHLVGWDDHDRLLQAFTERFWPRGKPLRGKPSSQYAAEKGADEDFPETYWRWLRGDRGSNRVRWLAQQLQGLGVHHP